MLAKHLKAQLGQEFTAKVVDKNTPLELIVSLDGALLRVINHTNLQIEVGDKVKLVVSQVKPVQFSLDLKKSRGFVRKV